MMARITSTMVGKILNKMYLYKKKAFFKNACLPHEQIFLFYSALLFQKLKKKNFAIILRMEEKIRQWTENR